MEVTTTSTLTMAMKVAKTGVIILAVVVSMTAIV